MISRRCPAKINLYLRILGRRDDGFHELETLFQAIDLADTLSFEPSDGALELWQEGDVDTGPAADNLVMKAAERFAERTGLRLGGRFHLVKRIPAGGGLGGGSSDAAGALCLLNQTYGEPLKMESLTDVAGRLGSDIPFFLGGGRRLGLGRGERLVAVPTSMGEPRKGWLLLPPFGLSTPAVYRAYAGGARENMSHEGAPNIGENDLLAAAFAVSTEFSALYRALAGAFEGLFMTGSGSSLVWLNEGTEMSASQHAIIEGWRVRALPFAFDENEKIEVDSPIVLRQDTAL